MYDYHTHTSFSDDSNTPIEAMMDAACAAGLERIAVTDHYDPFYPDKDYPFTPYFPKYHEKLEQVQENYRGKIQIAKGLEAGIQKPAFDTLRKEIRGYSYDFIIGSFHCAEGFELYGPTFFRGRSAAEAYRAFYQYMYECLLEYKDYDVLGHFNIIDRYTDEIADSSTYMDLAETILKLIIDDGKGIEINTSSFRYGLGELTTPSLDILKLYKELGGEIITTGSDAHCPEDVGCRLVWAQEYLKSQGFSYVTTFENRTPTFHKL